MTADLRILGTGRVLHHQELVGRSLCYFLSVTFAGRTFRWCFPSSRDIWVSEIEGDSYHFQGMDFPSMSQSFDFESGSPVDVSVSFEDLTFPGDVNLPELLAQGHRLERCEAELAALPDHHDALWSNRQLILVGEVREPVYGDPETHANTVAFTADSPAWEDVALFPPDDWVVTEEVWPNAHESAIGKVYPFVFGQPGIGGNFLQATPALAIDGGFYMFAGHLVAPTTVDYSVFTVQNFTDVTDGNNLIQALYPAAAPHLGTYTNPTNGFQYTGASFIGVAGHTFGNEIWSRFWSTTNYAISEAYGKAIGGYPNFTWDGPLITAGDVLYFMLLQSSLKVDRGRTAVAQALLQAFRVGGYLDERVTPYEWITDNLLPILPVAMSQGPKGIFPIVWRYDAGPSDCVGTFIEGPRWRRVSGVERDDTNILNKYTLSYGLDGSDFRSKFGIDGAVEEPTDVTETGATYVPNLYARRSFLEHGTIAVDESSDLVWTKDTAAQICAWKIRANALAKRFVTYEATAEHAWLEPGDPIMVTDPDLFFDEQVCLVRTKTWDVTSVLYELMILTDPVREQVPVVEAVEGHVSDASTLVLLKMEVDGSSTFIDESSYARTITTNGSVVQDDAVAYYGEAGGTWGGTNSDYLSWADAAEFNLGTGDWTIEGWARTSNIITIQALFWMGDSNQETRRFLVYMDAGAGLRFFWKDGSVVVNNIGGGGFFVGDDTWFHWCVQREGDNIYLHKDGALIDTDVVPGHSMRNWTGDLRLGREDLTAGEAPWLGDMDDFRFSNVARYGSGSFTP